MSSTRIFAAAATMLLASGGASVSGEWPVRPVTMVVPFAAGSGTDIVGRVLSGRLAEVLGQQVVVENVSGAGGMTGTARVARAAPDGYQFVLGTVATHAQNQALYKNAQFDAVTDFEPVVLIADVPQVLIARKDLPVANLRDFIAFARANQASMKYGSAGPGSASHLACVLLNVAIGVEVTHVPYRGAAPAMQDLIGGWVDYQCPLIAAAIAQIGNKDVLPLAILTQERSLIVPDLPSAHEQGLAGFEATAWHAIFLPKGTPAAIVRRLHQAVIATMETPAVREALKQRGATLVAPERRSPEYLAGFVHSEAKKWAAIIKAAKLEAN